MSLRHIILGFLDVKSQTGYDLKRNFDQSVSAFWSADQSCIYRMLDKLREAELVSQEVIVQDDHPNRKVYTITPEGRRELEEWLGEAQSGSPKRMGWIVQLLFLGLTGDKAAVELLQAKKQRILNALEEPYPEEAAPDLDGDDPAQAAFYHELIRGASVHMRQALIAWIDDAITQINRRTQAENAAPVDGDA